MFGFVCRFCRNRGCLACDGERAKWEARQAQRQPMPNPVLVVSDDNPASWDVLKAVFHRTNLEKIMEDLPADLSGEEKKRRVHETIMGHLADAKQEHGIE